MTGASAVFSPEYPVPGSFCIPENACRIIALFYYPTSPRQPLSFCRKKKFFILPFHQNGVTRMTPGPVAINSATFVGMRIGGIGGALVATLGCILPSCAIVLTLSWIYFKYRSVSVVQGVLAGLRPTIVALIASAGVTILLMSFFGGATESLSHLPFSQLDWVAIVLFALCLILLRKTKVSPLLIMAGAGVVGMIAYPLINR